MGVISGTPVNWRWDPFTETYNAVLQSNENHEVPGSSPYQVRLDEVPREDSPSSVDCVILVELDEDLDAVETGVDVLAAHYDRVQINDVLLCDDEQMLVTAKPGSPTLTVTRGYGGTGADTHSDGTLMEILASMTEITSGSPASREFRVDYTYNTGLVLFNSAQGGYDVRFDYYGLGTPFSEGWLLGDDYVITDKILNEAVTVGKLKFTSGSSSGSVTASSTLHITLNAYSHYPATYGAGGDIDIFVGKPANTSETYRLSLVNNAGADRAYSVSWHYHSSSPPDEMWISLSRDGKRITGVWKAQPVGPNGQSICPMQNSDHRKVFRFIEPDMRKVIKSYGKKLNYGKITASDIVNNELLKDIILRQYKKNPKIYRTETT